MNILMDEYIHTLRGYLLRLLNVKIHHINEEISQPGSCTSIIIFSHPEVGIYKRKEVRKKERKNAFDKESDQEKF